MHMKNVKRYEINGKTYLQRSLVLGQIRQLTEAMAGVAIPPGSDFGDVAGMLADRLPHCAAAVLQPEGVRHEDKDLDALAAEFAEHLDLTTADQVIDDFFALTPATVLTRLLGRIQGVFAGMRLGVAAATMGGLTSSSSSLPEATSPSETPSSGATH